MTTAAWIFMSVAWTIVMVGCVVTMTKILKTK